MGGPRKGPLMHNAVQPPVLKPGAKGMARLLGRALDNCGYFLCNSDRVVKIESILAL